MNSSSYSRTMSNFSCEEAIGQPEVLVDESSTFLFYSSLAFAVSSVIYFPVCFIYFLWHRKQFERLWRRSLYLLTAFFIGSIVTSLNNGLRNVIGASQYPCIVFLNLGAISVVFLLLSTIFRLLALYFRISFNRKLLKSVFKTMSNGKLLFKAGYETFKQANNEGNAGEMTVPIRPIGVGTLPGTEKSDTVLEIPYKPTCLRSFFTAVIFRAFCWKKSADLEESMQMSYFLASSRFINGSFTLLSTAFLTFTTLRYLSVFPIDSDCVGCGIATAIPATIGSYAFVSTILGLLLVLLRKHSDTLGIKKELFIMGMIFLVLNAMFVLPANLFFSEVERDGKWDWALIIVFELYFFSWFTFVYQVKNAKKQENSNNDIGETIYTILDSEEGTQAFALYLAVHLSIENLFFYKAVENWKKTSGSIDQARDIVEQYIGEDSVFQINLSHFACSQLKQVVTEESVPITFFDKAQAKVLGLISSGVFHQFLKSKYYKMYKNQVDLGKQIA